MPISFKAIEYKCIFGFLSKSGSRFETSIHKKNYDRIMSVPWIIMDDKMIDVDGITI